MDVLNKKISSFRSEGGSVRKVSDELLMEILLAWEEWRGPAEGFYKALGVSRNGISSIIGKAKKLKREGFPTDNFKEIKTPASQTPSLSHGIEVAWANGNIIRFSEVDQLVDFLRAVGGSCTAPACPAKKVA